MHNTRQPLLFVGDSMIEFFNWQEAWPALQIINLGRAGETVTELQYRSTAITERFADASLVLVMIGTNNIAMEDFGFGPAYESILTAFGRSYPDAVIAANSILPMSLPYLAPDTVPRMNERIREAAANHGARFVDVHSRMVDENGIPLPGILEDGVHITRKGYAIWVEALEPLLAEL